jgi:hypothetical protein
MQQSFFDVVPVELGQLGSEPAVAVLRDCSGPKFIISAFPFRTRTFHSQSTTQMAASMLSLKLCPGARDAQASDPAELDLERLTVARRNVWPAVRTRRHHDGGKTGTTAAQFLAPAIDLTGTNIRPARHLGNDRARRKCGRYHRPLLILAPASPPLWAAE